MITLANIRRAIYCLNKKINLLGEEHSNIIEELSNKVSTLESLISDEDNPTAAIDKFNEIVAFLDSIENTETLQGLLGDIILSIPTKVSELENDQNFLTEHQSLSNLINSDNKLNSDLVDDFNTNNKFVTEKEKEIWNNKSDFSGSYNDLNDKPDFATDIDIREIFQNIRNKE